MKIFVCLKEVIDPALSLDNGLRHGIVFKEGLPRRLNPSDAAALVLALNLKSVNPNVEITAVSIGGAGVESYLRNALALGADKALRIWNENLQEITPYQKAVLLSAVISLSGADLVFTGVRSLDTSSGQVSLLLAARLGFPCIVDVVSLDLNAEDNSVSIVKDLGRGEREMRRCPLPAVVAVKGEEKLPYASLDKLIDSKSGEIALLTPADLAISPAELKNCPVIITGLTFPRPHPVKAPPLDSSLPAFYRILQLLEGGISKRKGTILEGSADELTAQLFQLFLKEGVIKSALGR